MKSTIIKRLGLASCLGLGTVLQMFATSDQYRSVRVGSMCSKITLPSQTRIYEIDPLKIGLVLVGGFAFWGSIRWGINKLIQYKKNRQERLKKEKAKQERIEKYRNNYLEDVIFMNSNDEDYVMKELEGSLAKNMKFETSSGLNYYKDAIMLFKKNFGKLPSRKISLNKVILQNSLFKLGVTL